MVFFVDFSFLENYVTKMKAVLELQGSHRHPTASFLVIELGNSKIRNCSKVPMVELKL